MNVRPTFEAQQAAQLLADSLLNRGHHPDDEALICRIGDNTLHMTLMCARCFYTVIGDIPADIPTCLDQLLAIEKAHPDAPQWTAQYRIAEFNRYRAIVDSRSPVRSA